MISQNNVAKTAGIFTWSGDVSCRKANILAWSGCSSEVDGRRLRSIDGVGEPAVGDALGDIALDTTRG